MPPSNYVSLHTHTDFSFKDSICKIPDLVKRAKELNHPAIAITDHGGIYGIVEFYEECKKNGIKPIIGCEFYIVEDINDKDRGASHIVLLAMNNVGLENIIKLTTWANTPVTEGGGFYYNPRIDVKRLFEHHEGIIVLTACVHGLINRYIVEDYQNNTNKTEDLIKQFLHIFGDRFYLEVQMVNTPDTVYIPEQNIIIKEARRLGKKYNIKVVASSDTHYINREDKKTHEIWKAIGSNQTLDMPPRTEGNPSGRIVFNGYDYYLQTEEEMLKRFDKEEVYETTRIAERCNVEIVLKPKPKMPRYSNIMTDEQVYDLLVDACRKNVMQKKLFTKNDIEYVERIKKEFADIKEAGLQHYFMIVYDICKFADDNGIKRGVGRGSAPGSLISKCLNITQPDPIKYGLIWERFYNAGRANQMPDIDGDVCIERRNEIIEYLRKRFGNDRIYPMCTISSLAGKAALKDVGRTLGIDFGYMNHITSLFPHKCETIKDAIEQSEHMKQLSEGVDSDVKRWEKQLRNGKNDEKLSSQITQRKSLLKTLFYNALRLEGCKRQRSSHACAILIADKSVGGLIPLCYDSKTKKTYTAWDMYTLESLGYLKMDILGLKSVTVIDKIRQLVKKRHNVDTKELSEAYNDAEIFKMITNGNTVGIFQLESYLGQQWSKKIKPKDIIEWSDIISIIRPAVLETGLADEYVQSKNTGTIKYLHDNLKPILEKTQGICLYQEQMIEIAKQIAGFSLVEADKLRKCCGKKLPEEIKLYKEKFIDGCLQNKYDDLLANKLWEYIEASAMYSFNLAHSISYAFIGYILAYYKHYYPIEFYKAMLDLSDNKQDAHEEISNLYYDALKNGIQVLPPDLNRGNMQFEIVDDAIYYGLGYIKSIGKRATGQIKKLHNLSSKIDLLQRIVNDKVSYGTVMPLLYAGCFDRLTTNRFILGKELEIYYLLTDKRKLELLEIISDGKSFKEGIALWHKEKNDKLRNVVLSNMIAELITYKEDIKNIIQMAQLERDYTGINMRFCEADICGANIVDAQKLGDIIKIGQKNKVYRTLVCVQNAREITSKKGNKLILADIFDTTGRCTAMFFGEVYDNHKNDILNSSVMLLDGSIGDSFFVKNIQNLDKSS